MATGSMLNAASNIFEDKYLGSAEFADYLVKRRVEAEEFLRTIGVPKPTSVPRDAAQ